MMYSTGTRLVGAVALTAASVLAIRLLRLRERWRVRSLPGPTPLPLLGNLLAILGTRGGYTCWRSIQRKVYGSIYTVWFPTFPEIVVSDPDLVRKVAAKSNKRPVTTRWSSGTGDILYIAMNNIFAMSPEDHGAKFRAIRKAFEASLLNPAGLESHEPMLRQCAEHFVAALAKHAHSGQPVDMARAFDAVTMDGVGFAAFGIDLHCMDALISADTTADKDTSGWLSKPGTPEFGRGLGRALHMTRYFFNPAVSTKWKLPYLIVPELETPLRYLANLFPDKPLRDEHRANKDLIAGTRVLIKQWKDYKAAQQTNDTSVAVPAMSDRGFLVRLLEVAESEGLSELDVIAQAIMMLMAGYEATSATLASAVYMLQEHTKIQARLQSEVDSVLRGKAPTAADLPRMPYLRGFLNETLRVHGPVTAHTRWSLEDYTLPDGKKLKNNLPVVLDCRSIHLDPSIWPRADEFLPERWMPGHEDLAPKHPNAYMPMGLGGRECPGQKYAILEACITLAALVQHFTFSPAPGLPKTEWESAILYTPDHVWTTLTVRSIARETATCEVGVKGPGRKMLMVGYESTSSLLASTVHLLHENPKAQARLQTEVDSVLCGKVAIAADLEHMPYLCAVIDESLRLISPVDTTTRVLDTDMRLPGGKVIPRGVPILISLRSMHLDPSIWPRADEFLPERWMPGHEDLASKHTHAYAPWGMGGRTCAGFKFALMEARLALAACAQHYTFSPAPGLPKPQWNGGMIYTPDNVWSILQFRQSGRTAEA